MMVRSHKQGLMQFLHLEARITQSFLLFVFASLLTPLQHPLPTASSSSALKPNPPPPLSLSLYPLLPLSGVSLCRGMAGFLLRASAAAVRLTALIACSRLGIGHCMTTCFCAVTNQKTNTGLPWLLYSGQTCKLWGEFFNLPQQELVIRDTDNHIDRSQQTCRVLNKDAAAGVLDMVSRTWYLYS